MSHQEGQAPFHMNKGLREGRSLDELIGLCKGVIADGQVVKAEAKFLLRWIEANAEFADKYPVNVLYRRVDEMLSDGVLDKAEQAELLTLLHAVCGNDDVCDMEAVTPSTSLPLNSPMPEVVFEGRRFVLTGQFIQMPRKHCETVLRDLGGSVGKSVTLKLDYLVVGPVASRDWKHTSFGNKIKTAVEYRDARGKPLAIISEDHLLEHVARLTADQ